MWVKLDHFAIVRLDARQRSNKVPMRDNRSGMNTIAPQSFCKHTCAFVQHTLRFDRNPAVIFFALMPPTLFQMREIKARVKRGQLLGRAANITAIAKLFTHRRIDLKRKPVPKNQMGRLQGACER